MDITNYAQIYKKITKDVNGKIKGIFDRRFGVHDKAGKSETLEAIGRSLGVTRERVRQIEEAGFKFIRKNYEEYLKNIFKNFDEYFTKNGGFKKEEKILEDFSSNKAISEKQSSHIIFFLTLSEKFSKVAEKKDYHYFWANTKNPQLKIKEILNILTEELKKSGRPVSKDYFYKQIFLNYKIPEPVVISAIEISKKIKENRDGLLGLIEWAEIKPRGVKDKAFLVFKQHKKPLHFTQVAKMIDESGYNLPNKKTYSQTVHNELIKDPRFVLVGRGIYALADWGYTSGTIKDVLIKILKDKKESVHKDQLIDEVLKQRIVSKNTILMNLNNKNHFDKDEDKYFLKGVQIS